MSVQQIDFTPTEDGRPVDPTQQGGVVTQIDLYTDRSPHAGMPVATGTSPTHVMGSTLWTFTVTVDDGTYWVDATWSRSSAETATPDPLNESVTFGDSDAWASVADARTAGLPSTVTDAQAASLLRQATQLLQAQSGLSYGRTEALVRCERDVYGAQPPRQVRFPGSFNRWVDSWGYEDDAQSIAYACIGAPPMVRIPVLINPVVVTVSDRTGLLDPSVWDQDEDMIYRTDGLTWAYPINATVTQGQDVPDDAQQAAARLAVVLYKSGPQGAFACGLPANVSSVNREGVSIQYDNEETVSEGDVFVANWVAANSSKPAQPPMLTVPGRRQPRVLGSAQ